MLKSEADYEAAMGRIRQLMDADFLSFDGAELDRLVNEVVAYETLHFGFTTVKAPPDRTPEEIVFVAYYATDPQVQNPAQAIIAALASHGYAIVFREAVDPTLVQPNGSLHSHAPWVDWTRGGKTICLDGDFDADELLAMSLHIR